MRVVSEEKLARYFDIAERAFAKARESKTSYRLTIVNNAREEFLDTVKRYIEDAKYFKKKDDMVNAFAALNYAHGWLDAGAKLGIFDVRDSKLFAGVDYEDHN